jgi:phage terminase small subunit
MNRTTKTIAALSLAGMVALTGCSQKYSAERDGKKLGEGVCDLRTATTPEDAADAVSKIKNQLGDLGNKYALFTAEDRNDVQENLSDLAEHRAQGNTELMQQDIAVLERSAQHIAEDTNQVRSAAWEGFSEGLAKCSQ